MNDVGNPIVMGDATFTIDDLEVDLFFDDANNGDSVRVSAHLGGESRGMANQPEIDLGTYTVTLGQVHVSTDRITPALLTQHPHIEIRLSLDDSGTEFRYERELADILDVPEPRRFHDR